MARQALKPPFAYYGGKTTLAPEIAALLPEHDHYVEPFAGSLAVLLAKEPSRLETVNDLDDRLVTFWTVLRDQPRELERVCALTPQSRAEYERSLDFTGGDVEIARRVWVALTQGRTNSLRPAGWRAQKRATVGISRPMYLERYVGRFATVAARLKHVSLESRDAVEMIEHYGTEPSVCIYADPPYLGSTRAANYGVEMLEDELHVRFGEACNNAKAAIVVSGYASPLYEDIFAGWHRMELKAPTKLSGAAAENEVLWSNRPFAAQAAFDFGGIA